jgi:hypothetical protein
MERIFPKYFEQFKMPKGAREEMIQVYRACKSGKCDAISFVPTYEERGCNIYEWEDKKDPGLYSLSTYAKPKDVKRFATMDSDMHVPYKIAIGKTDPKWGLVQPTKERVSKKTSHVDWWLYKDARPYESFQLISDFENYLAVYKIERDEKNVQVR